jgi:hypothetical protein
MISVDAALVFEVTEKDQKSFPVYGPRGRYINRFSFSGLRGNRYDLKSAERLGCIFREPSDICPTDRIMLYVEQ